MSTMNISLPETLKTFVDTQVVQRGYGTSSEYVRELIRKDQDRLQLRDKLLVGASSAPTTPVDSAYLTACVTGFVKPHRPLHRREIQTGYSA
jgi:antitoxin ParD1/3/4